MEAKSAHTKLSSPLATAICGNDILSSALYVSGIAIIFAGAYAPLVLLLIVVVLYFYKSVYTEVVEALPINGGAYNCLLNGTSKTIAAIAGITTLLSYVATAVISAKVGVEYFNTILPIPVIPVTIALLLGFALLVIGGIKDSAKVAFGIFLVHILSLTLFLVFGVAFYLTHGGGHFLENLAATGSILKTQGGLGWAFYLAFSASLLGVSGFESSANFVEEQERGVFRKTLRNMLIGVAIFNPLIALVVLNALPIATIAGAKDFLLADVAQVLGGDFFKYLIVIDATLVLAGAVLTSFVGVSGLLSRMTLDSCLPRFLNKTNRRGSHHRIIIAFFLLCTSILLITKGDLLALAGVYTIAFLSVMCLFAAGNLILRQSRTELKRTYQAPFFFVILAFFATFFGILGNIRIDEQNLKFFELYFVPAALIVLLIIYQDYVMRFLLRLTKRAPLLNTFLTKKFSDLIEGRFVAFIRSANRIHSTLEYINRNETGRNITLVYCSDPYDAAAEAEYAEIEKVLPALRAGGVFPHLNVELYHYKKPFGPEAITEIAEKFNIHTNRILIGSIHESHAFEYEELSGARIIF